MLRSLLFLGLAQVGVSNSLELGQLQPSLLSLAEALRQDLTGDEEAARRKLKEKAGEIQGDDTARLLRHLAWQGGDEAAADGSQVFSQSSSESQVSDGKGHVLRHVKTCKNGVCEEHTERSGEKGDKSKDNAMELRDGAVDREISKLQKQMRNMEQHIKLPDFNDILAPVGEDFWQHFRSMPLSSNQTGSSHSESMSEETVMRNGHAVRRLRRCKNGKCHTTVEEGNLTNTPTSVLDLDLP